MITDDEIISQKDPLGYWLDKHNARLLWEQSVPGVGKISCYIIGNAIGNGWSKGLSVDEAKRQARRHARRGTRFNVYRLPGGAKGAYVDDVFGCMHWAWDEGAPDRDALTTLVEKNGKAVA